MAKSKKDLIKVAAYDGCQDGGSFTYDGAFRSPIVKRQDPLTLRLMIGIPMTGLVRAEWMMARYGQVFPCNWSQAEMFQFIDQLSPINFMVADARNIIATTAVEMDFEWLLFIDHDVVLPQGFFLKVNERMIQKQIPVWSGLYWTKSIPSEPLIYRGAGTGYYDGWEFGDEVWVDGVPMGMTLIHTSILKALYESAESYQIGTKMIRKIFKTPAQVFYDPAEMNYASSVGTEDLDWCKRVIEEDVFGRAGWKKYSRMKYPFMIDTGMFGKHIDNNGRQYPSLGEDQLFMPKKKKVKANG